MVQYICPRCGLCFDKKCTYEKHANRKIPCPINTEEIKEIVSPIKIREKTKIELKVNQEKKYYCEYCGGQFTRIDNMKRHQKKNCSHSLSDNVNVDYCDNNCSHLIDELNELKSLIKEVAVKVNSQLPQTSQQSHVINNNIQQNILQVLCVGNKDNYLDMLTEQWGNFDRALEYIKDCALSSLTGDCKLLNKIYFDNHDEIHKYPIKCLDRRRGKVTYIDENNVTIIDPKGLQLGKKLANSLQNTYLKGVNYLITKNLEDHLCPNKFLEEYDIQNWNKHIYELSDYKYQRKIINHLEIPSI